MKEVVYQFLYTDCIHESAHATISLHKTKKGAELAMEFHKEEKRKEHEESYSRSNSQFKVKFGQHENWCIGEIEIFD